MRTQGINHIKGKKESIDHMIYHYWIEENLIYKKKKLKILIYLIDIYRKWKIVKKGKCKI